MGLFFATEPSYKTLKIGKWRTIHFLCMDPISETYPQTNIGLTWLNYTLWPKWPDFTSKSDQWLTFLASPKEDSKDFSEKKNISNVDAQAILNISSQKFSKTPARPTTPPSSSSVRSTADRTCGRPPFHPEGIWAFDFGHGQKGLQVAIQNDQAAFLDSPSVQPGKRNTKHHPMISSGSSRKLVV